MDIDPQLIDEMRVEIAAHKLLLGFILGEAGPATLDAVCRLARLSDEATLPMPIDDRLREGLKAVLEQVAEEARLYRERAYPQSR